MLYDSEMEILLECFAQKSDNVLVLSGNGNEDDVIYKESIKIYETFLNSSSWLDNSANTNYPPDIINDELKVFFEVMRFDDHSNNGKDNPNRARASKMEEELYERMPFLKQKRVFINTVTELPTDEDHSYQKYLNGFKRTVEKHLRKIPNYSSNYPNYKKGFLVFDESSGLYYNLINRLRKEELEHRTMPQVTPHLFFLDKFFVEAFIDSDLDYLIWYAPYKIDPNNLKLKMPKVVFYDIKNFNCKKLLIEYEESKMISCEV